MFANEVHAQVIGNPALPGLSGVGTIDFIQRLLQRGIELFLIIGAVIFVFMLILGAINWITAGGDRGSIETARSRLTHGIVGIILLFGVFAIISLLQDFLGFSILSFSIQDIAGNVIGTINLAPGGQFAPLAGIDFPTMVSKLLDLVLIIGAVVFVFMLLVGAIQYITAGGDKGALESAKQRLTNAIIGIFILFGLWAALDLLGSILGINLTSFDLFGRVFNLAPGGQFAGLSSITFSGVISAIITIGLIIGCVVFIFMLILGGIQYITAGGDKGAIESARERIKNALIGIFILLCIFVIAGFVGRFFGVQILSFGGIGVAPPPISPTAAPTPPPIPANGTCDCVNGSPTRNDCILPGQPVCSGNTCACFFFPTATPTGGVGFPPPSPGYAWCGNCDNATCNLRTTSDCTNQGLTSPCTGNCSGYTTPTPTLTAQCAAPTLSGFVTCTGTGFNIYNNSWNVVSGTTYYRHQVSGNSSFSPLVGDGLPSGNSTQSSIGGTGWYFRVRVESNGTCTAPSNWSNTLFLTNPCNLMVPNNATGQSCTTVCNNNGGRSCVSVGLDSQGTDGRYMDAFIPPNPNLCATGSASCGTVMINEGVNCSGRITDWTNCNCL